MSNQIYFSHSFACDLEEVDLIRRFLKKQGYEVLEHSGSWSEDSMQKFLACKRKLILTPDVDSWVGRGQAEMVEETLLGGMPIYAVSDFTFLNPKETEVIEVFIAPITGLEFTRMDMKTDWAELEFSSMGHDISSVWPILNTSFDIYGDEIDSIYDDLSVCETRVKPILATALLD